MEERKVKVYTYATGTAGTMEFEGACVMDLREEWAIEKALKDGWDSWHEFKHSYTWDDTSEWVMDAKLEGELLGFEIRQEHNLFGIERG